jgi:hypothetical protein
MSRLDRDLRDAGLRLPGRTYLLCGHRCHRQADDRQPRHCAQVAPTRGVRGIWVGEATRRERRASVPGDIAVWAAMTLLTRQHAPQSIAAALRRYFERLNADPSRATAVRFGIPAGNVIPVMWAGWSGPEPPLVGDRPLHGSPAERKAQKEIAELVHLAAQPLPDAAVAVYGASGNHRDRRALHLKGFSDDSAGYLLEVHRQHAELMRRSPGLADRVAFSALTISCCSATSTCNDLFESIWTISINGELISASARQSQRGLPTTTSQPSAGSSHDRSWAGSTMTTGGRRSDDAQ